ncbi:MAG: hypothetical protein E6474_09775 [Actinomyces sp.]|nr:hypothetical protein [Actinomyces sp.]
MAQKTDTPWVRIAQSMPHHPKIAPLSDTAFRTLVEMICYSAQYELDGKVPANLARRMWTQEALEELASNDQAAPSLTLDGDMYLIHGYTDMQETRAEITARREASRVNGRKGGRPKTQKKPKTNLDETQQVTETKPSQNLELTQRVSKTEPKPNLDLTQPKAEEEKEEEKEEDIYTPLTPLKGGTCATAQDFTDFYNAYPRHVGRKDAERAFKRAAKTVSPQTIIDAARRLAADPNLPEKQFIPHPATWLNQGRWDDEPLPDRSSHPSGGYRNQNQIMSDMRSASSVQPGIVGGNAMRLIAGGTQ